jgi:hypothetical protein
MRMERTNIVRDRLLDVKRPPALLDPQLDSLVVNALRDVEKEYSRSTASRPPSGGRPPYGASTKVLSRGKAAVKGTRQPATAGLRPRIAPEGTPAPEHGMPGREEKAL